MSDSTQSNAGSNGAGEGTPQYVTKDEFDSLINKAITSRFSAFEKKNGEAIKTALGAVASDIDKLLTEKFEAFKGTAPADPKAAKDAHQASSIQDSPEFKGLQKQLAETAAKVKAAEERAQAETAKSRDVAMRQRLSEELTKRGFEPSRVRHAVGLLVDAEKRVRFEDDSEELVFKDTDGTEVDLGTGLSSWSKTDDAKIYMPPRGSAGSGDRGGGRRGGGQQKTEATLEDVGNFVLDAFPSMTGQRPR